jgi:branched-chain amino acid aminotransferase
MSDLTGPPLWVNDRLVSAPDAAVSVFDHGLTVGDGVFETLQIITAADGTRVPFARRRHLERLARSAAGLGLGLPDRELLERAIDETVAADPAAGRLRITVTGGVGPLGSDRGTAPATLVVATAPLPVRTATASVATVAWRRNEHSAVAGLKTTSYAENVVALADAAARGASEAIFANTAGELCEGTGSNVFVVVDGTLCTPPLSSGCLAGITRELVCEISEVDERALPLSALAHGDEAFLTSSTRDVQPIHTVDGVALPAAPGPITQRVAAAFSALLASTPDP